MRAGDGKQVVRLGAAFDGARFVAVGTMWIAAESQRRQVAQHGLFEPSDRIDETDALDWHSLLASGLHHDESNQVVHQRIHREFLFDTSYRMTT